jgi:ankyrin repeat protein
LEVVQILVELKADINAPNRSRQTPLHVACLAGETNCAKVVRFLLDHGADASLRTADGATPLYCASVTGRQEMARMLLEHGVDIEATNDQGWTPLQIASARQHKETVKLLLEYGAK